VEHRHDSISTSVTLIDCLLRFGLNHLTVDYYFAILTLAHTFSLNREEHQEVMQIESLMNQYLAINKNKSQTAQTWLCKLERLFKMQSYGEVQAQVNHMAKFCSKYGLYEFKFAAELILVEVYLAAGDIGQAMVLLSQTVASLEQYPN